jgi:hypothetical protein
LSILHGLRLSDSQRRALGKLASQRFKTHAGSQPEWATRYLALLFSIDARNGASTLIKWLRGSSRMKRKERALIAFSLLFGRNQALAGPSLDRAPVQTLEQLVVLAYQEFNPENDIVHVGVYSMSSHDDAESGRNVILTALIDAVGPEAYAAMIRLSNRSDMKSHRIRFRELARRMAERD